jgi:hypothetical protein
MFDLKKITVVTDSLINMKNHKWISEDIRMYCKERLGIGG